MRYLDESFWRQQFFDSQATRDSLADSLSSVRVQPLQELAEVAVRQILLHDANFGGFRIYSPEQSYGVGETLNILTRRGARRALVEYIDPGRSTSIGDRNLSYDLIGVQFRDGQHPREHARYVSNCPNFPTRFSDDAPIDRGTAREQPFTPGQIVMRFKDAILGSVKEALTTDARFCSFDGGEWMLTRFLVHFGEQVTRKVVARLRVSEGQSAGKLAELVCGVATDARDRTSMAFSVSYHLNNDPRRRFAMVRVPAGVVWTLAPPPKQVVCALDQEMIAAGGIRVSGEFQKIADFYGLTSVLDMQAYGGYSLRALYEPDLRLVHGDDVKCWIEENGLSPGHKVYIKSPASAGAPLVLFSEHEYYQHSESGEPLEASRSRQFLRHKVYVVLVEAQQWLHYREIAQRLKAAAGEANSDSILATLSSNGHLFCRREPSRGLWGLNQWVGQPANYPVNLRSLSITIREEQWVQRILREEGAPLPAKEVIRRLSEIFGIRIGAIQELTIIDGSDPAILQARDGRLVLSSWIPGWEARLRECQAVLVRCRDLRSQAVALDQDHETCQGNVKGIGDRLARQRSQEDRLAAELARIEHEVKEAELQLASLSQAIRKLESELILSEHRCTNLSRWRAIALASYSLLLIGYWSGARPAVQVIVFLGSTAASLSVHRLQRRAGRKVKEEQERLHDLTVRASTASRRGEQARQALSTVEAAQAAEGHAHDRLENELDSLRRKERQLSHGLAAVRAELSELQEPEVAEERARLLELLSLVFSEVAHGR